MHIRDPEDIERDRLAVEAEAEADDLMDNFSGAAPVDLARNLMVERDKVDMQPEIMPLVAEVLRGRQSEWLKGRRWPQASAIPGRQELQRTSYHTQPAAPDDVDQGVLSRDV